MNNHILCQYYSGTCLAAEYFVLIYYEEVILRAAGQFQKTVCYTSPYPTYSYHGNVFGIDYASNDNTSHQMLTKRNDLHLATSQKTRLNKELSKPFLLVFILSK